MKQLKYLFGLLTIGFAIGIIYGVVVKDFGAEGGILLSIYWGWFTMGDIYLAFLVIAGWVVYREGLNLTSGLWTIAIMLLGSLAICAYLTYVLHQADGDWEQLMLGKNKRA